MSRGISKCYTSPPIYSWFQWAASCKYFDVVERLTIILGYGNSELRNLKFDVLMLV